MYKIASKVLRIAEEVHLVVIKLTVFSAKLAVL